MDKLLLGKIKYYDDARGFGFIKKIPLGDGDSELQRDFFFHISKVKYPKKEILADELVVFNEFLNHKGMNATNVLFVADNFAEFCEIAYDEILQYVSSNYSNIVKNWFSSCSLECIHDNYDIFVKAFNNSETNLFEALAQAQHLAWLDFDPFEFDFETDFLENINTVINVLHDREIVHRFLAFYQNRYVIVEQDPDCQVLQYLHTLFQEYGVITNEAYFQQHIIDKNAIKDIMQRRGITSCYHFTRLENLDSIFKHGLVPRADLNKDVAKAYVNDDLRIDGALQANCLSIGFPNYKMFYKYRMLNGDDTLWVVLELDSSVILDFDCAFCFCNAASNEVRWIPLQKRATSLAFEGMFNDEPLRQSRNLPNNFTTNPQAELLVFGTISPNYIRKVYFVNDDIQYRTFQELNTREYARTLEVEFNTDTYYFSPRCDYTYW